MGQGVLCDACRKSVSKPEYCCQICGQAITGASLTLRCSQCLAKPPAYEHLFYVGNYDDRLSALIIRAKVARRLAAILALQILILDFAEKYPDWGNDFADYHLLAMPSPRSRLMQRGFNLPWLLAKTLSQCFGLPIVPQNRVTLPFWVKKQAKLNYRQRQKNQHRYIIHRQLSAPLPQKVVIVDDIVTTGTTVNQLSQQLRQENIANIVVWAMARVNDSCQNY